MTSVPLDGGDVIRFTPSSFANLASPPVILLKAGTRRDLALRERRLKERRARFHGAAAIRSAIIAGLTAHWDAATAARFTPVVKAYWDARDQYEEELKRLGPDDKVPAFTFDGPASEREILDMLDRLRDVDDAYNALLIDNETYFPEAVLASMVFVIAGWEGIDAEYGRSAGAVTDDAMDALSIALTEIEADPANAKIEGMGAPGTAMMQLAAACGERMFLTESQRKNSPSPSRSSPTPPASRTGGNAAAKRRSGKSRRPAASRPTRAT